MTELHNNICICYMEMCLCASAAETSTSSLLEGLKEEGFQLKQSILGRFMASSSGEVGGESRGERLTTLEP